MMLTAKQLYQRIDDLHLDDLDPLLPVRSKPVKEKCR